MTLEASFDSLGLRFKELREAVCSLQITVREDKPLAEGVALVDYFSNTLDDLFGCLEGADTAARQGLQAVEHPTDLQRARRSLVLCQRHFNDLYCRSLSELLSYDRLAELVSFGNERGGEWYGWSNAVKDALECCRQPAFDVTHALFLCWQEIAEGAVTNSVSVNATNIGQMIEGVENKESVAAGVP